MSRRAHEYRPLMAYIVVGNGREADARNVMDIGLMQTDATIIFPGFPGLRLGFVVQP